MAADNSDFEKAVLERFQALPAVVQQAIVSADVSNHLRELAKKHNLHLDQWGTLENEVRFTLLGIQKPEDLARNIQKELGLSSEASLTLAADISELVFAPIRDELERILEHPEAKVATTSDVDAVRAQEISKEADSAVAPAATPAAPAPTITPATPPAPAPDKKVERAPLSETYMPSVPSHERKAIDGDPYREQLS